MAFVDQRFTVQAFREAFVKGEVEPLVHEVLKNSYRPNPDLSARIRQHPMRWIEIKEIPLSDLKRITGSPQEKLFFKDPEWQEQVDKLVQDLTDTESAPPFFVERTRQGLVLLDGNHRHEAYKLKGWDTCWVLLFEQIDHHEKGIKSLIMMLRSAVFWCGWGLKGIRKAVRLRWFVRSS